tara:strand:- start:10 stop:876 length:867 start_codon:yes stop_codon:yes gene_type:complete
MKLIKYFIQFIFIIFLFLLFKILGPRLSKSFSSFIFKTIGPHFKSKKTSNSNLTIAFPELDEYEKNKIVNDMWATYGKIFSEYIFIKNYRQSAKFSKKIIIENQKRLEEVKQKKKPVIFISGHFDNFELMAMHIEKSGIDLAAIYRPLNNKFLNPIMENIRKKYICKKQIQKGISGTKELLREFKKGTSIALMIDQRVSEGVKCDFFGEEALTTTIPAQFIKKFGAEVVPIYIERSIDDNFKIKIFDNIQFPKSDSIEKITLKLNKILEKMIMKNPQQWIWTHNRWKI